MEISITAEEIKGKCPVYNVGDKIFFSGPEIVKEKTDAICIHALPPLLHFVMALREGADPLKTGLAKEGKAAYVQRPDPGEPYTNGGTVIFKIERLD